MRITSCFLPKVPVFPKTGKATEGSHFRYLSRDEEGRLLAAAAGGPPWLAPAIRLMLACGLLRNEAIGLTRQQIDLDRALLLVDRQGPDGAPPRARSPGRSPCPQKPFTFSSRGGSSIPARRPRTGSSR